MAAIKITHFSLPLCWPPQKLRDVCSKQADCLRNPDDFNRWKRTVTKRSGRRSQKARVHNNAIFEKKGKCSDALWSRVSGTHWMTLARENKFCVRGAFEVTRSGRESLITHKETNDFKENSFHYENFHWIAWDRIERFCYRKAMLLQKHP